jgi:hypothetical protein
MLLAMVAMAILLLVYRGTIRQSSGAVEKNGF